MAEARAPLPDEGVRDEVRTRLGETLFVEAGAGSGKTSCLVARFVALVESGVPADAIAAITFTEQAAAELVDRVRQALQEGAASSPRCAAALEVLDRAAICTLHSFAQRILVAHPLEAGIPPRVKVLDEISSGVAFERRWRVFVDRVLEDPDLERPLRLLASCGKVLNQLRDLALAFGANWDLVAERLDHPVEVPPLDVTGWCDEVDALVCEDHGCKDPDDPMQTRLRELGKYAANVREALDEESALSLLMNDRPSFKVGRTGKQANYPPGVLAEIRERVADLEEQRDEMVGDVTQASACRLADAVARFTLERAESRRRDGHLEFHDLLVMARGLLRDPDHGRAVRAALRDRYQRLLLDEFQDTDPIQVELAVLIPSTDPDAGGKPWAEVEVEPGRLFVVGDPKQSIYRFRRADIGVFLQARQALAGAPHQLTTNFRAVDPIVDWVNRTFGSLIVEAPGSQPAYVALDAVRPAVGAGPAVAFVGSKPLPGKPTASELRDHEAAGVAAAVASVVEKGWSVGAGDGSCRTAGWRDVCILVPARTSLTALERALHERGVPYRVETSSLVYGTREIRDLLAVARAIDDPTDELSLVTALRSPALGCGDDDLYTWKVVHGGRWDHQARLPESAPVDHPVALAFAWLGEVHRQRPFLSASEVLERIVRERRLMQIAFADRRPRDLLRRLRFVVDQARAWEDAGGGSLRDYLGWIEWQSQESARVVETVLPETDDESVRIMTVHGAKGLEFPVTVLSGMTTQNKGPRKGVQVLFPPGEKGWALRLNSSIATPEFEAHAPRDEQMDEHERLRLLYVAATRARDHLVVSVCRRQPNGKSTARPTSAELFWAHGCHDDLVTMLEPPAATSSDGPGVGDGKVPPVEPVQDLLPREEWEAEHRRALAAGVRPVSLSATRLAEQRAQLAAGADPGLAKGPRDLDLPPWQKGRYGTAIGRAVHGVLQTVDLATGEGLDAAVAAQVAAEGIFGHEPTVAALSRAALDSPVVAAAAAARHWREVYVGVPLGDLVLEGYVDLLYRTDAGLVVVDYKTDSWRTEAELFAKVARYTPQLGAYAYALEQATGERVAEGVLLFLAGAGATVRRITDLPAP